MRWNDARETAASAEEEKRHYGDSIVDVRTGTSPFGIRPVDSESRKR